MTNAETIQKYELMLIVDAALGDSDKEAVSKSVADAITNAGGKVINSSVWLEKQKLTFEIKKRKEGTYYLINFEGDGSVNQKTEEILKLNEKILRYGIFVVE